MRGQQGRFAWRRRRRRAVGAALGVTASLALAVGCGGGSGSTHYLDTAKVQQAIQRSILQQRRLKAVVVCPKREPQKPHQFTCIATTVSRTPPHRPIETPFRVSVLNDEGRVTYVGLKPAPGE